MKDRKMPLYILLGIIPLYVGNVCGYAYFTTDGDLNTKLTAISKAFDTFSFGFNLKSLLVGGVAVFFYSLAVIYKIFCKKKIMPGIEHGSADWGTSVDIAKFKDKENKDNNMIFTETEQMSLNTRQTMRNNNVLVIGGSGSGKTRFFIKPNLLQLHSSYVVTDPKGTVLNEVGKVLADDGYIIKVFNTVDFSKSMRYNPFTFIKNEADIKVFVDILITSTNEKGQKSSDPFWENSERLLYMALIGYIYYQCDKKQHNFASLLKMLNAMEVKENDENFMNSIDFAFEELKLGTVEFNKKYKITEKPEVIIEPQPEHFAVTQYTKFKMSAGKTAKSILISCGVRLSAFDIAEVREMTMYDEMELSTVGDKKTALFIIIDDKVSTFNFLANMMYSQLFKELCDKADNEYHGRLPVHVRCLLDEFSNIGQIPNFEKIISIIRSREISVDVIVQNMAQIEALYDKQAGTIVGNCDTTLFLGSGENSTMKNISERVGKATISHKSSSTTKGQQGSFSLQNQILGRELITPDEVGRLDNGECILFIRGLKPFKSKKYNYTKHPRYKQTGDANGEFMFKLSDYKKATENDKNDNFNLNDYTITEEDIVFLSNGENNINSIDEETLLKIQEENL